MLDKTRKVIYIIVGCLTILTLVFGLAKKVGLCASSDNLDNIRVTSYPLPVGYGFGYGGVLSQEVVDDIISETAGRWQGLPCVQYAGMPDENTIALNVWWVLPSYQFTGDLNDLSNSSSIRFVGNGSGYRYDLRTNSLNPNMSYGIFDGYLVPSDYVLPDGIGGVFLQRNVPIPFYPLYYDPNVDSSSYNTYFTLYLPEPSPEPSPSGHSKGNVIINYEDSIDQIEADSSLPSIDVTPPSDPSNNVGWFQKILNGLKTLGDLIKAGVITIGDYIGQGIQDLKDHIDTMVTNIQQSIQLVIDSLEDFKDRVVAFYNWVTEPFDQNRFTTHLQTLEVYQEFSGVQSGINTLQLQFNSVTSATSNDVKFSIPFTFPYINTTYVAIIDFSWYENIRSVVSPFIVAFLIFGFAYSFIRSLPGIIHGNSPEGDQ